MKMQQTAAQGGPHAARTGRPQRAALPGDGRSGSNCSNDDFIRTTEERHYRVVGRRSGSGWQRTATSISTNMPAGTRCATRPTTTRTRPRLERARRAPRPAGHAGRMGRGGELFLQALRLSGQAARPLRSVPDFVLPKERRNEVASFVKGGLQDLSISRTTFDWGIPVPGDPKHVMYVWVDALTNYITGVGYPGHRQREVQALLAGRPARHRQGHRALPRGLLAGLPDVGRHRGAAPHLRATASCSTAARRCRSRSAT